MLRLDFKNLVHIFYITSVRHLSHGPLDFLHEADIAWDELREGLSGVEMEVSSLEW